MQGKAHRAGAIQCNACRKQFTVTVGTVMESSKVALHKWVWPSTCFVHPRRASQRASCNASLGLDRTARRGS